jgi:peptidoglycan/xylan/chitin deacetylase (PgdA/CDA1 family)
MQAGRWARRAAKSAAAGLLHGTGLRRALRGVRRIQAGGRRIVMVGYHRVVEDFTGEVQRSIPGTLVSRETFRHQLEEAHRAGFELASLSDALDVLAGRRRAPRDLFVVTFDDGYRDVYDNAFPVLKALGVPATLYVASGYVGTDRHFAHDRLFHLVRTAMERRFRPLYDGLPAETPLLLESVLKGARPSAALDAFISRVPSSTLELIISGLARQLGEPSDVAHPGCAVMGWDEVRRMAGAGITLGAHTVHHTVLTLETPERAGEELAQSRAEIERQVGCPVLDFAYCNGWYSDALVALLVRHGYRSAITTEDRVNRVGGDPYALKRKVLWEDFSRGVSGGYSAVLTGCTVDDTFGTLGLVRAVEGRRPQRGLRRGSTG